MTLTTTPAAPAPVTKTAAPDATGTEAIVEDFAGWASPILVSMAALTEQMAATLTRPASHYDPVMSRYQAGTPEYRAQLRPGLVQLRVPRQQRTALSLDLTDLVTDAERRLSRWVGDERTAADRARAEVPVAPEAMSRAISLSSTPPDRLLAEAEEKLREGDPEEADVLLRAAVAGGKLRGTSPGSSYGVLRRRVDAALDNVIPERSEAAARVADATRAYSAAMARVTEYRHAADAMLAADPEDPTEAVARARQLAATGSGR